ncbi:MULTISPECIES: hypothetical protein [Rhizobium]|uniref:Uncharacterized protein n=1 Tax=Rhizobium tropici TaxID=398 RepID=A0A6P1C459_RHITR|nr:MULTISPECIES: hypothetical protein [Rhizobium]MBB4243147.1 hypothetical protein [Rhizobium tropici]MBB5594790.1 hypothetical protein [Rhizobium tropici]MBB6493473.1 hypothetical protein [Rhizobium tropici]NEV11858.1 hypothetical protein [Rhizobium tropici]
MKKLKCFKKMRDAAVPLRAYRRRGTIHQNSNAGGAENRTAGIHVTQV